MWALPGGVTPDAVHVGSSTAALALAVAQTTAARVAALELAVNTIVLPVVGAAAGPPAVPPFPVLTTAADIATLRLKVDQ